MTDTFTVKATSELLNVSPETVRRWTNQFSQHLSDTAAPEPGQRRTFTRDDIRVLAYVRDNIRTTVPHHEIDKSLNVLGDAELPVWEDITGETSQSDSIVPTDAQDRLFVLLERMTDDRDRSNLHEQQIDELHKQIDTLKTELSELRQDVAEINNKLDSLPWYAKPRA